MYLSWVHISFEEIYVLLNNNLRASLVAQMVKNPLAMQETWLQSLGQGDPLEKGMETHSSILAWRIPWTKEPGRLQSMGSQRVRLRTAQCVFCLSWQAVEEYCGP